LRDPSRTPCAEIAVPDTQQDSPLRGLINAWPAIAALIIAAIGLVVAKPSLESPRPTPSVPQPKRKAINDGVPARLWQDPLAAVWAAQDTEQGPEPVKNFENLFKTLPAYSTSGDKSILILFDCLPGDGNPETSEQRRRERYSVLSAFSTAGYAPAPVQADRLSYARLPAARERGTPPRESKPESGKETSLPDFRLPFEWATAESAQPVNHRAVCVVWVGDDYLPLHPLRSIIHLKTMIMKEAAKQVPGVKIEFAIAGRLDSKPLRDLLADDQAVEVKPGSPPPLKEVTLYVTRSTAPFARDLPPPAHSGLNLEYVIGTDDLLAERLVEELELRSLHPGREGEDIAIIAEWDSQYGRKMPELFEAAVRKARDLPDGTESRVASFVYLRGLDGKLAADKPGDTPGIPPDTSTPAPTSGQAAAPTSQEGEGQRQFDYVRRLAELMKSLGRRFRAIGVVGSDVYDKLILLQELRPTFPEALFFTTDLDARLLQPADYAQTTRNLIIISHYGLSFPDGLQGKISPFRSGYDAASYLGCLRAVGYEPVNDNSKNKFLDVKKWCELQNLCSYSANHEADALLPKVRPDRKVQQSAYVFEVSRDGAYQLTNDPGDTLAARSSRWQPNRLGWFVAALFVGGLLVCLISRPTQRLLFYPFQQQRKTDNIDPSSHEHAEETHPPIRRVLVVVFFVVLGLTLLILALNSHLSQDGEPFEILAGISVWPMMLLRFLAVGLCCYFIVQASEELGKRNVAIRRDFCLPSPSPDSAGFWRRCWDAVRVWHKEADSKPPGSNDVTKLWAEFQHDGTWLARLVRCAVMLFLSVLFCVFLGIWTHFDLIALQAHARGPIAFWCSHVILFLTGITLTALLVFVADSTLLCYRFITRLGRRAQDLVWPHEVLAAQASAFGLTQKQIAEPDVDEALKRGALLRFVERVTYVVAHMIYYPFIVLLLLLVAQNRLFDDCPWNIPLVGIALLCAGVALICAVYLQRTARKVRADALNQLARAIQRRPESTNSERAILEQMQAEINNMNSGAITSIYQNPIVMALLLPLGGGGGLAALSFLLGH
jgi:hypothetical protein